MSENIHINTKIPLEMRGQRLDRALAQLYPEYSRARWQQWIREGLLKINGHTAKPKAKLLGAEEIELRAETIIEVPWVGQNIPLNIVYEDEYLIIVNKPAGLVVHPGAGQPDHTLVNALLHYAPELEHLPRAGIIHRIDKETTGLLVVARQLSAHTVLVQQLQQRAFLREYLALVRGVLIAGGTVDAPIGRHPRQRVKMAVVNGGRNAITHYRVAEHFRFHSLLQVKLETGRTHQIRVHMTHLGHPLVGDPVYGGRYQVLPDCPQVLQDNLKNFKRQALHAAKLGLKHPKTGEMQQWQAPLPDDMQDLLVQLQADRDEFSHI